MEDIVIEIKIAPAGSIRTREVLRGGYFTFYRILLHRKTTSNRANALCFPTGFTQNFPRTPQLEGRVNRGLQPAVN